MTCPRTAPVGTDYTLHHGDALAAYPQWPAPDLIISDGAYGVAGFAGDPTHPHRLPAWYRPHIAAWSAAARPGTSLWFWCTEVGWASGHPELVAAGWDYVQTVTWDKGTGHIAGNVNGTTIRRFPVVSEACVLYERRHVIAGHGGALLTEQEWLRWQWRRSGLPMREADTACGVASAASRKYLTTDQMWYRPPGHAVAAMARWCTAHGDPRHRPYFSLDGRSPVSAEHWDSLRRTWNHQHGLTTVWASPAVRGPERLRLPDGRTAHGCQKPATLIERLVVASSDPGDVVWEPFAGLGTISMVALGLGRTACLAETDPIYADAARQRLNTVPR